MNNLKTVSGRKFELELLKNQFSFNNKILIIGCGSIGASLLYLIINFIKIDPKLITIIDKDILKLDKIQKFVNLGVNKHIIKLDQHNTKEFIINYLKLSKNDIIIDASYEISTKYMYQLCSESGISYINSSVESWEIEPTFTEKDYTFSSLIEDIILLDKQTLKKENNFIIGLGGNPGNVNIWTLYALDKINNKKNKFSYNSYAELAQKMGLRVIHISEKDSQITNKPRKRNEYLNTWSSDAISWYGEAIGNIEISWGTHEKNTYDKIVDSLSNPYQKIMDRKGYTTFGLTYTPISRNTVGMLIRHEECYTICRKLSIVDNNNNIVYKPSCYYVYKPCDSSMASINELIERNNDYHRKTRLMTCDIIEGRDELGCNLFFENGEIWWIGSLLDINEARLTFDNQDTELINATLLQVLAGYMGGLFYLIQSIQSKTYRGLLLPEDMPVKQFLKWTRPLLGPFGLMEIKDWNIECKDKKNLWQFSDFLIN